MLKLSKSYGGVFAVGASLALLCGVSSAQTTTSGTPASAATNVGVTPATAAAAADKAVPRSDTGTVVRTGPTATERARQVGRSASAAVGNAGNTNTGANTGTTDTTMQPSTGNRPMRPARADRN